MVSFDFCLTKGNQRTSVSKFSSQIRISGTGSVWNGQKGDLKKTKSTFMLRSLRIDKISRIIVQPLWEGHCTYTMNFFHNKKIIIGTCNYKWLHYRQTISFKMEFAFKVLSNKINRQKIIRRIPLIISGRVVVEPYFCLFVLCLFYERKRSTRLAI